MYKAQDVPVSWGFCLITVTRQIMQGLDEELLLVREICINHIHHEKD